MRTFSRLLSVTLMLAVLLGGLSSGSAPARAEYQAFEAGLNSAGVAYEINADSEGSLWISDFYAGEIWRVDAASGNFRIYSVGGSPSDARRAGDFFYWVDGGNGDLGRADLDGSFEKWNVPDVTGFYGTAVDAQSRLWTSRLVAPDFYRLDPAGQLCAFTLPDGGLLSGYLAFEDGHLYFGDDFNGRLLRLRVSDNRLEWWGNLPTGASPFGLAVDGQGRLWYADANNASLAVLNPNLNQLTSYPLPAGSLPAMVAIQGNLVWYTDHNMGSAYGDSGGLGVLDTALAAYTTSSLTHGETTLAPVCSPISPSASGNLTVSNGSLEWGPASYPAVWESGGWQIYQMPSGAFPWGIASLNGTIYAVDNGRQVLIQLEPNSMLDRQLFLPMIIR